MNALQLRQSVAQTDGKFQTMMHEKFRGIRGRIVPSYQKVHVQIYLSLYNHQCSLLSNSNKHWYRPYDVPKLVTVHSVHCALTLVQCTHALISIDTDHMVTDGKNKMLIFMDEKRFRSSHHQCRRRNDMVLKDEPGKCRSVDELCSGQVEVFQKVTAVELLNGQDPDIQWILVLRFEKFRSLQAVECSKCLSR